MPYTADKPKLAESSDELRARIPGWGVDLDPKDRPSVPKEQFDPNLNGNGGGPTDNAGADTGATQGNVLVGSDTVTATNAANRDYAQPVFSALDGDFTQVSNGYAGAASDGLRQLDASRRLIATYTDAAPGNLVQTGKVDLGRFGTFTLALGFGSSAAQAVGTAKSTLRTPLWLTALDYLIGWHRYDHEGPEEREGPEGCQHHHE